MTNKPMGVAVYPHVTTGPTADTARVLDAIDELNPPQATAVSTQVDRRVSRKALAEL